MNRTDVTDEVAELLKQTGHAHHQAFLATDGADPEWPLWYAEHAKDRLNELLGVSLTQSEIVALLVTLDQEHRAQGGEAPWPAFYAEKAAERFVAGTEERLALYHFDGCPFCLMVRATIEELGIDVELRNIRTDPERLDELVAARGRATVPVLQCTSADGMVRWMPESRDIVRYLRERFGSAAG
ncbi:MAG: glutathione S-transferase N-terminal domain-containing protein [Myxococcota bacterium]